MSSKSPTIQADNLRSEDSAEMLVGLCEGPIEGLVDGQKSFYMSDTPLVAENGDENFTDYELEILDGDGSIDEPVDLTLGGTALSHSVGVELSRQGQQVTRYTTTANIDYIDVRVTVNSLYKQSKKGDVKRTSGVFRIETLRSDQSDWVVFNGTDCTISGKTTSQYVKDYRVPVEKTDKDGATFAVRLTRVSEASSTSGSGFFFNIYWTSYEEVDATERSYPNTALAHLTVKTSEQLSSLPQTYGIYKLLKIKVPSNYDPETHTTTGLWDGTFKVAWTDNPAWCLYDLITNDRYGVNAYYPVTPDKWDFYEAAQYCDEQVSDGRGGTEPRYTLNILITESQSGPDMLNYIASTFNGIIYEDGTGLVRLAIEDPEKPAVQIFNPTNITSTGFNYTFTDPSQRYNDFTVTFINPSLDWSEDRRNINTPFGDEDQLIYNRIPYNFNATGCITESEAIRRARFKLISCLKETMSVSFTTNRAAMNVNLFDTILIADPNMNYSQTGRIKSISENRSTVYLRDPVFIESSTAYEFYIQTSHDVFRCGVNVSEYGNVYELELDDTLPENVYEKAVFSLTGTATDDQASQFGSPKPFRVMSITEQSGNPDSITIMATEIFRLKQYDADTGEGMMDTDSSTRNSVADIPQVLDVSFKEVYNTDRRENALILGVTLDWDHYPNYTGDFRVFTRLKDSNDPWTEQTVEDGDTIYGMEAGDYEFRVMPETTLGLYPSFDSAPIFEFTTSESAAPKPEKVQNFAATGNINNIKLTWDVLEDAEFYEIRIGDDWDTGTVIAEQQTGTEYYYTDAEADTAYRFMIKGINVAGDYSDYAAVAYGTLNPPKAVKKFWITPNLDSLRFDWVAEDENNVSYEVRAGVTWESGVTLFTTMGHNQTVLNPGYNEDTMFFIKTVSQKGMYSETALYGKIKQNLKQNRNVILEVNNAEGKLNYFPDSASETSSKELTPWYGVTHGLTPSTANTMQMSPRYFNAEHFFPITIPNSKNEDTIARNWYDVSFFRYGKRLKFGDLDWAWDSEEGHSTTWLNAQEVYQYGNGISLWITTQKAASDYSSFLGLRFNDTTKDMTETVSPSTENYIQYRPGKYDDALVLYKKMKLIYTLKDLPTTFSLRFKLLMDANVPADNQLVTLRGNGIWIKIYMENENIVCERSDGAKMTGSYERERYLDYMNVMITQSDDKIALDYSLEYGNNSNRIEANGTPLGIFTKLYFGQNNS